MTNRSVVRRKDHPKIVVSKFGEVKRQQIEHTLDIVEECYGRLEPHNVELVDLYFFEKSSAMEAFMIKESNEVGVVSTSFTELFFAMHDAYRGTSRIILCLERMGKLPKLVQAGGIRHEVGHSVLHGSLQYYVFPLPPTLHILVKGSNISQQHANNLLYLISVSVKDYEVSRLLYKQGYIEDQIAYTKNLLTITESDKLAWQMARGKPLAEVLCVVSCLKSAACTAPFLSDKTFGKEMRQRFMESLIIPAEFSNQLLNIVLEGFPSLGTDTFTNINHVTYLVVENIAKPILLS